MYHVRYVSFTHVAHFCTRATHRDLIACGFILFPIVWMIKHLRDASTKDGKANAVDRLKLFRQFYIITVVRSCLVGWLVWCGFVWFGFRLVGLFRLVFVW